MVRAVSDKRWVIIIHMVIWDAVGREEARIRGCDIIVTFDNRCNRIYYFLFASRLARQRILPYLDINLVVEVQRNRGTRWKKS